MRKKIINVVGLGYIGLPTALILEANGNKVVGTDQNSVLINQLKQNEISFHENGLQELYVEACKQNISFQEYCIEADIYIVAVPTPYIREGKKIDPSYVVDAVKNILRVCKKHSIIAIESTLSPGTIDRYIRPLLPKNAPIALAHVPERIIPGNMLHELVYNPRVIGVDAPEIGESLKSIYRTFCKGSIQITNILTAEMTKVIENTYRDVNIAFANELAKICKRAHIDVHTVIQLANMHPRVNIMFPGPGVGGHCISVDPWFLVGDYPDLTEIIHTARKINDSMPEYVLECIYHIMEKHNINDLSRVGLYGLTYKENVNDTRESPTLQMLDCMKKHLADGIKVYDPFIKQNVVKYQMFSLEEFIQSIDFIVVLVGHNEIVEKQNLLRNKIVFDTRNVLRDIDAYRL